MNIEKRFILLKEAYKDDAFQQELKTKQQAIKERIEGWLDKIPRFDAKIENVFHIHSRIKSSESFEEKLYRKNYVYDWDVSEDKVKNQEYIKRNLPDIIGFRINCYFVRNEKIIYDQFKTATIPEIVFDFTENTKQKNNHDIWKFSGMYNNEIHFEVQIKSIVHDIWGEVEHKTIYKNPNYDSFLKKKEELSSALYDILFASDKELYSIFTMSEDEEQLMRSLFFVMTRDAVKVRCGTDVLAIHYVNYFNAFSSVGVVKKYIASRWIDTYQFILEEHPKVEKGAYEKYKALLIKEFPVFYLKCIYEIDKTIYQDQGFDEFLYYFLSCVYPLGEDDFYGGFTEMPDEIEPAGITQAAIIDDTRDFLVRVNDVLSNCIINKKLIKE